MTDYSFPNFYMSRPHVDAFQAHLDSCSICQEAASQRTACEVGRKLHEAAVLAAHENYFRVMPELLRE